MGAGGVRRGTAGTSLGSGGAQGCVTGELGKNLLCQGWSSVIGAWAPCPLALQVLLQKRDEVPI